MEYFAAGIWSLYLVVLLQMYELLILTFYQESVFGDSNTARWRITATRILPNSVFALQALGTTSLE
jgi:hypothetical protein